MRAIHQCLFLNTALDTVQVRVDACGLDVEVIVADEVVGVDQHRLVAEWDQKWELIVLELVHRRLLIDRSYHISVDPYVRALDADLCGIRLG